MAHFGDVGMKIVRNQRHFLNNQWWVMYGVVFLKFSVVVWRNVNASGAAWARHYLLHQLAEAEWARSIFRPQFKREYVNYLSVVNRPVRHLQAFERVLVRLVQPVFKSAFDWLDLKFDLVLGFSELSLKLSGLLMVTLRL
jgi:hypothetical protein